MKILGVRLKPDRPPRRKWSNADIEAWTSRDLSTFSDFEEYGPWVRDSPDKARHPDTRKGYVSAWLDAPHEDAIPTLVWNNDAKILQLAVPELKKRDKFGLKLMSQADEVDFADKMISVLQCNHAIKIKLENCVINALLIVNSSNVTITNCVIGTLTVQAGNVGRIDIEGGRIVKLGDFGAHLSGPVSIRSATLPSTFNSKQPLIRFRDRLDNIKNHHTANLVHAAEMRCDRERMRGIEWWISKAYDLGSGYGTEIAVPLLWLLVFFLLNMNVLLLFDATATDMHLEASQRYLEGDNRLARLARTAYLTFAQTIYPPSFFAARHLVYTTHWFVGLISVVLCFLGTLSLALFVLTVRKRFRMESSKGGGA